MERSLICRPVCTQRDLTSGEVARYLGVAQATAIRINDTKLLPSYRLTFCSSKPRRVRRSDLIAFMRQHDIPIPEDLSFVPEDLDRKGVNCGHDRTPWPERNGY